jgi:hypothetical protein
MKLTRCPAPAVTIHQFNTEELKKKRKEEARHKKNTENATALASLPKVNRGFVPP